MARIALRVTSAGERGTCGRLRRLLRKVAASLRSWRNRVRNFELAWSFPATGLNEFLNW